MFTYALYLLIRADVVRINHPWKNSANEFPLIYIKIALHKLLTLSPYILYFMLRCELLQTNTPQKIQQMILF